MVWGDRVCQAVRRRNNWGLVDAGSSGRSDLGRLRWAAGGVQQQGVERLDACASQVDHHDHEHDSGADHNRRAHNHCGADHNCRAHDHDGADHHSGRLGCAELPERDLYELERQ